MTVRKAGESVPESPRASTVTYHTKWGDGWVTFDERGPAEMGLPGSPLPGTEVGRAPAVITALVRSLEAYWAGGPLPAAEAGVLDRAASTSYVRRIYEVVSAIPRGKTLSYAEVATIAGRPGASRSVGAAMARNPFAPIIPCHRVVGSDGSLRGYGGGLDMKRSLLAMEKSLV